MTVSVARLLTSSLTPSATRHGDGLIDSFTTSGITPIQPIIGWLVACSTGATPGTRRASSTPWMTTCPGSPNPRPARRHRQTCGVIYRGPDAKRAPRVASPVALTQRAGHLAGRLPLGEGLPLVVLSLASRERYLDLGFAVLEIERERHQREATLFGFADQSLDFQPVQQELARATRLVIRPGALGVLGDVHAHQPRLAVLDDGIAVDKGSAAGPQ